MTHHVDKCVHGRTVSTCRCTDPHKQVRIVDCPPSCNRDPALPGDVNDALWRDQPEGTER